jgi:Anti-sigma factor NepR
MKDRKQPDQTEKTGMGEDSQKTMDIRPAIRRGSGQAGLTRDIQAKLGLQLRAYYDGLIEPTPNRFVDLLRQLDEKPGGKDSE